MSLHLSDTLSVDSQDSSGNGEVIMLSGSGGSGKGTDSEQSSYHRRKTDKYIHRPVTIGHVLSVISALLAFIVVPLGWALWTSHSAVEHANDAHVAALKAAPDRYTGTRAATDWMEHKQEHSQQERLFERRLEQEVTLAKEVLLRAIDSLEIPPPEVRNALQSMDRRLIRIESLLMSEGFRSSDIPPDGTTGVRQ